MAKLEWGPPIKLSNHFRRASVCSWSTVSKAKALTVRKRCIRACADACNGGCPVSCGVQVEHQGISFWWCKESQNVPAQHYTCTNAQFYIRHRARGDCTNWGERSEAPLFWVVRNRKPWYVETGWYDRTSGRGLPLARDRSAAEPPAPRFTAILADTAELSHCQERPGLVNLPIGLQGQHC